MSGVFPPEASPISTSGPTSLTARWVKVMAGRGNELTRDSFQAVWDEADSRLESVQILLPNPDSGADSYLAHRESEIQKI